MSEREEPEVAVLERVAAGLDGLAWVAEIWPTLTVPEREVMVFDAENTWYVGDHVPEELTLTGAELRGLQVARAPRALQLSGQVLPYEQIGGKIVGTILWRSDDAGGTHPVFLVQELDALVAAHAAFGSETSVQEWLAIFVHEAFHTHQLVRPDLRQLASELADRSRLDALADGSPAWADALEQEWTVLTEPLRDGAPDPASARAALSTWLELRDARLALLAEREDADLLARTDAFYTYLEGTARYTEVRYLVEGRWDQPTVRGDPRFDATATFEGCGVVDVPGRDGLGRTYYYALGMAASFLLDAADPTWRGTVTDTPGWLVGAVQAAVEATP